MMQFWGIIMHGVQESDLIFKDEYKDGIMLIVDGKNNGNYDFDVELPNGKHIGLFYETTEDDSYFGFPAGYPWEPCMQGIEQKDVEDAIVQVLMPYIDTERMTEENLRAAIDDISTYNCG